MGLSWEKAQSAVIGEWPNAFNWMLDESGWFRSS